MYRMGPMFLPAVVSKPGGPLAALTIGTLGGGTNWPGAAYDPETHTVYAQAANAGVSPLGLVEPPAGFTDIRYLSKSGSTSRLDQFREDAHLSPDIALLLFDVLAVVVFVLIGKRNHHEGTAAAGVLKTAAPFLIALVVAWFVSGAFHDPVTGKSGLTTWFVTVAGGLVLRRVVFGGGTAVAFVIVATIFLFLTMVMWRFFVWRKIRSKPNKESSSA